MIGKRKKEDEETHASNLVKKEKKKKKRDGQKLWLKSDSGSLYVVLFTKMPLSYEL